MRTRRRFVVAMVLSLTVILPSAQPDAAKAQTAPPPALTGQVSSQEEGPMEGVLVSVKREGATVTITVVSDAQGRYSFPRTKVEPGRYSLRIRAVGYELHDPSVVEITAQKTASLDLKLRKAADLAYQLTNAEWMLSMPGTEEQKEILTNCIQCHTVERIVRSRYTATQFMQIRQRMRTYAPGSFPLRPQMWHGRMEEPGIEKRMAAESEYLSTINLSSASTWQYPLKTLPRPKGKGTRVIITEYDLPRPDTMPHDAIVDSEGMVWYSDFGQQYLGRLDPKTAQAVEYSVPEIKPGFPTGSNSVEFDQEGNVWLGMMLQAGVGKFDRKTQKFQTWRLPKEMDNNVQLAFVMPRQHHRDGKVWFKSGGMHRLDVRSGEIEIVTADPFQHIPKDSPAAARPHNTYGIAADSQNNLYFLAIGSEYIGRVDAKTRKVSLYQTPTFNSAPRRGLMDSRDRLTFAEFLGNKIAMFDTKTERFQEWAIPTPWSNPYYAVLDKNGEAWAGGMTTDRVVRLNTKTGEIIEYLLPRSTNIRRVDVDNSTNPVTFWTGNNHGASIVKLEPLE